MGKGQCHRKCSVLPVWMLACKQSLHSWGSLPFLVRQCQHALRSGRFHFHARDNSSAHAMGETRSTLTQTVWAYATSQTYSSEQCVPIACSASEPIWASSPAARESRLCNMQSLCALSPPERAGSNKPAAEGFLRLGRPYALAPRRRVENTPCLSCQAVGL